MSRHYRKSIVTRQTTLATLALLGFSPLSQALSYE